MFQFPQSQKSRLRITPGLCFRSPGLFLLLHSGSARDAEVEMITAAEYRAWAEESLEWARIASKESSRAAYIQWAETWLELASRAERLTALIEDCSKEPTPTAESKIDMAKDAIHEVIEDRGQSRKHIVIDARPPLPAAPI